MLYNQPIHLKILSECFMTKKIITKTGNIIEYLSEDSVESEANFDIDGYDSYKDAYSSAYDSYDLFKKPKPAPVSYFVGYKNKIQTCLSKDDMEDAVEYLLKSGMLSSKESIEFLLLFTSDCLCLYRGEKNSSFFKKAVAHHIFSNFNQYKDKIDKLCAAVVVSSLMVCDTSVINQFLEKNKDYLYSLVNNMTENAQHFIRKQLFRELGAKSEKKFNYWFDLFKGTCVLDASNVIKHVSLYHSYAVDGAKALGVNNKKYLAEDLLDVGYLHLCTENLSTKGKSHILNEINAKKVAIDDSLAGAMFLGFFNALEQNKELVNWLVAANKELQWSMIRQLLQDNRDKITINHMTQIINICNNECAYKLKIIVEAGYLSVAKVDRDRLESKAQAYEIDISINKANSSSDKGKFKL